MLKTPDCGQFSFFTAHPGITRGGHYHHTKTEKFLVIKGQARFKFRHMQTGQMHELTTTGERSEIVETVPGWTHDITNVGSDEMIVMPLVGGAKSVHSAFQEGWVGWSVASSR